MNEEQSKRVAAAAEAVLQAAESVDEARESLTDARFDSDLERERLQAAQQLASRLENAAKRLDDALRKGGIAAAVAGRTGVYEAYREGAAAIIRGRDMAKEIANEDGIANKRAKGEASFEQVERALRCAVSMVFPAE